MSAATSLKQALGKGPLLKIAGSLVVLIVFLFSFEINGGWAWWHHRELVHDDGDYFSHACTIIIDHDFDYKNEVSMFTYESRGGLPSNPVGPGILAAPFVGAGYLIDKAQQHPFVHDRMQFYGSWSYFGFGFASSFYFVLGVLLYWWSARAFGARVGKLSLFLMCTGTGVIWYVLFRETMAHAYEFFCLALIVFAMIKMLRTQGIAREIGWGALVGLGVVFSWMCRYYALYAFILPFMTMLLWRIVDGDGSSRNFLRRSAIIVTAVAVALLPAFAVNRTLYKAVMPSMQQYGNTLSYLPAYQSFTQWTADVARTVFERFFNIYVIFFGSSYPIVLFSPIVPFGLFFLVYSLLSLRKRHHVDVLALLALGTGYVAAPFAIVLMWRMAGSAYGFRYLYGIVPLALLGLFLFRRLFSAPSVWRGYAYGLLVALSMFGTAAPVAFSTMPQIGYTKSDVNEFGATEVGSPRELVLRILPWMTDARFYSSAYKLSAIPVLAATLQPGPTMTRIKPIHPNMPAQAWALTALWLAFVVLYFYILPDDSVATHRQEARSRDHFIPRRSRV